MSTNPYAAPKAAVADETVIISGDFVPGGEARPAGNGWKWIAEGWNLFKLQPWLWIGMWLLFMVMFIAVSAIPFLGMVVTGIFWPVFVAGFVTGCRALDEGGTMELGHLFAGFRERLSTLLAVGALSFVASLVIGMIVGLVVGVGMFAMMGASPETMAAAGGTTMLLAVLITFALVLPVVMAVWFAPPLVVFQQLGAWEAMKTSFIGCLRNIVPFLIYGVIGLLLGIVAILPLGLGLLVLGPVLTASVYTAYRDIYFKPRP